MYKVLLVDDERTILEGISKIVDWESQGVLLSGTARNGIEAMEFISEHEPDIVISDISMPGLDGIELIEKSYKLYPSISWILLSGYNEFDYAQKAMRYGVKHYLLKPCNENVISNALKEIVQEIEQQKEKDTYVNKIESRLDNLTDQEKEQYFKELITNRTSSLENKEYFTKLVGLTNSNEYVRLLFFNPKGSFALGRLLRIIEITKEFLEDSILLAHTIIGNHLIILIKEVYEQEQLDYLIKKIQHNYTNSGDVAVVISETCNIPNLPVMYRTMLKYMDQRFYFEGGSIIRAKDISARENNDEAAFEYDKQRLVRLLKTGDFEGLQTELDEIFERLEDVRLKPSLVKSYLIQLYFSIVRKSEFNYGEDHLKEIAQMEEMNTLQPFKQFLEKVFRSIIDSNLHANTLKYSTSVRNTIEVVHENLENPDLSLQWLANEKLYMNADYLGKLFKKEVGERFSFFVTNERIKKAVKIIEQENDIKVFELAERLGFGNNPQYFSQIFKKIMGKAPSDLIG